ncbi:hypothetical protein BMS3Abin15_00660 [bacterium BMS3Abin15]|nr:hypothetical protein BMS3Abin15_00660 [bacterium BMS3Abin15]HDZ85385.1 DUF3368 domain-containing protein [Candidatus Moranbacteria bacterium]
MAPAISDSSVLIHLSKIGRLELLREFFSNVIITPAVWKEVVDEGKGRHGAHEVEKAYHEGWIKIAQPENKDILRLLEKELDNGEAEAIALAIENNSAILLVDETNGRKIARSFDLKMTGVIGILIRAKTENKIDSMRNEMEKLIREGGFRISNDLYKKALKVVGE